MDIENDSGGTDSWRIEGGSTNDMVNNGFDRNSLSVGDTITVLINPLKSGDRSAD